MKATVKSLQVTTAQSTATAKILSQVKVAIMHYFTLILLLSIRISIQIILKQKESKIGLLFWAT